MDAQAQILCETLRGFRAREVETLWAQLDAPVRAPFDALWEGLSELGVISIGLPEPLGGLDLAPRAELDVGSELGAACPALAVAWLLHRLAASLLCEAAAGQGRLLDEALAPAGARFALLGSPLASRPETAFALEPEQALTVSGRARVALAHPQWIVLPARHGAALKLVLLSREAEGVRFELVPSSHGLRLLPFGQLVLERAEARAVFDWPAAPARARHADALLTAILGGFLREAAARATQALGEHRDDAVQRAVGAMLLSQQALCALARHTLRGPDGEAGVEGAAAAFAVEQVRMAIRTAVRALGREGCRQEQRVERYLRDSNTLATFFIHGSGVARSAAASGLASASGPGGSVASTRPHGTQPLEPLALVGELRDLARVSMRGLRKQVGRRRYRECRGAQARARAFAERHVRPFAEQWDLRIGRDPELVAWPAIDACVGYGLLSGILPARLGGPGEGALAALLQAEELAVADAGVCMLFLAHGQALATLAAARQPRLMGRMMSEIVEGERHGRPVLLAFARGAQSQARYRRVEGGYLLSARATSVRNGSVARYVLFTAWQDEAAPMHDPMLLVVPNGAPGCSVAGLDRMLGQRLCPAAELVCQEVFIPAEQAAALDEASPAFDSAWALARAQAAALSAGIARGALERTLRYLEERRAAQRASSAQPWLKHALADMVASVQCCRGLYLEAALALEQSQAGAPRSLTRLLPRRAAGGLPRTNSSRATSGARWSPRATHTSIARDACGEAAMRVCLQAMDVLGEDANHPRWGVEKCLRDATLAQASANDGVWDAWE